MAQVTLRDYLQKTEDAISAERIDDALSHCQIILAQFPESLEVQRLLGEVYLAQQRLDEAQQSFDWVLTNDPENVVTYCDRALISESMSDFDTALDCYQQAYELSRGNSQIRKEFNKLSVRAGQQGFMFSRAGLARLYMRGDLLTQAIQEWEGVLAVSPDRLDARTGLLETYWREGLYDRVEQLATQILQDVPGCLKAVLLLAYVTSAKNMPQAQDLLKRAEELDPDLLLAQELFADAIASQPAEPFFKLLRKPPVFVETSPVPTAITHIPEREEAAPAPRSSPPITAAPGGWNGSEWPGSLQRDSGDAHRGDFMQERQPVQDSADLSTWGVHTIPAAPVNNIWSGLDGQQEAALRQEMPGFAAQPGDNTNNMNPWPEYGQSVQSQEASWRSLSDPQYEQKQVETPLWENPALRDNYNEASFGSSGTWEDMKESSGTSDPSGVWASSTREEEGSAPPVWLNMLTQGERRQASGSMPSIPPIEQPQLAQLPAETRTNSQNLHKEEPKPELTTDDEESFFFGPEWLKSLGAATMDTTFPIESSPTLSPPPSTRSEEQQKYDSAAYQRYESQPSAAYESPQYESPKQETYEAWTSQVAESPADQNLLKTLEELESDLRSQGFVPLEPNSLSSIAETREAEPPAPEIAAHTQEVHDPYKEPALSSALAELGNFIQQSSSLVLSSGAPAAPAQSLPSAAPTEEPAWLASLSRASTFSPTEEPSWLTALNSVPASSPAKQEQNVQEENAAYPFASSWSETHLSQPASRQEEVSTWQNDNSAQHTWAKDDTSQEPSTVGSVPEEVAVNSVSSSALPVWSGTNEETFAASFTRSEASSGQSQNTQASGQTPTAHNTLDSELETTMKRPAVRLEPMYPVVQEESVPPTINGRTRSPERTPSGRTADNNLSYQERLLKGYQHQLLGDYDEAMQEYRIIIRGAPELLADVVSNVRALLKLAPKYSAGYRVLGDAYMRQGEYLQAMEAYNKALTMAKRAKS